jgi:hypothetical protein
MPAAERHHPASRHQTARPTRIGAATPDQIERRPFAIEEHGYDRDEVRKFLAEVAATLRLAQRSTVPPVLVPLTTGPGAAVDASAAFDRASADVGRILRAAEVSAQTRRDETEALVASIIERAEHDADDLRRQATEAAALDTERARRVLLVAQQQAEALTAEAELRAAAMLDAAREHARQHARRIAQEARRRADEVAETEGEALLRLNQARLELVAAIDSLSTSRTRAVLDITGPVADIHLEASDPSTTDDLDGPEPQDLRLDDDVDPTRSLIQRAVDRATAAAIADPVVDLDALGASRARLAPVRPSVSRRQAHKKDAARPCPTAVAPTPPAAGRATPARRPSPDAP